MEILNSEGTLVGTKRINGNLFLKIKRRKSNDYVYLPVSNDQIEKYKQGDFSIRALIDLDDLVFIDDLYTNIDDNLKSRWGKNNQTSFNNNSKVKKFALYINGNLSAYLELEDKMDFQKFNSSEFTSLFDEFITNESESPKKFNLKFEIVDVFQGLKYKDTCISELSDF